MRFHVPNNEVDALRQKDSGEESESEEQITASKLFNDRILQKANIGQFAGAVVASIQDLPMQIPRGNYTLDFY